jgi:hypothetical protein
MTKILDHTKERNKLLIVFTSGGKYQNTCCDDEIERTTEKSVVCQSNTISILIRMKSTNNFFSQ